MATTIVERNILKDHPAIAVSQVFEKSGPAGIQANVTVHGWRNDNSPRNISEIMRQAEGGKDSADFELQAEVIAGIDAEEEKAAMEEVSGDDKAEKLGDPARDQEPPEAFWEKKRQEIAAKEKKGGK
jgi:hypothetical protein